MKSASPRRTKGQAGITLLELTVVVTVILSLAAITMIGANAWRRGVDRASCVLNIRNVQTGVRAYQNLYGYDAGTMPYADGGTQSIAIHLEAKGFIPTDLHEMISGDRSCPGGGDYSIKRLDVFPQVGELYVDCSYKNARKHKLSDELSW